MTWPMVPLGDLIAQDKNYVSELDNRPYNRLSVKLNGRGAVLDAPSDGATVKMAKHQFARSGQIIVSEIWAKKGAIGIVPEAGDGALVTSHFYLFDIVSARLHPRWMYWLLRSNYFEPQLSNDARGSTGYASVRPKHIQAATAPLPSLHEQRRMVKELDAAAATLDARACAAMSVETEITAMLSAAFAHIVTDAPRRLMAEVAPLVRRPVTIDLDAVYPALGVRSFGRGLFIKPDVVGAEMTWQSLYRIETGDLVFSNIKAWEGAFAVAGPGHAGKHGSHRYLTCVPDPSITTADYLWYYLQTDAGLRQIGGASVGSADRNRTLATKRLAAIAVPIPSLDAQQWFDRLQAKARSARLAQTEAATELAALLPAMLHEAFGDGRRTV